MSTATIYQKWRHCEDTIQQLMPLWRHPQTTPPCVFVYGNSRSLDKAQLAADILAHLNNPYVHVSTDEVKNESDLWSLLWERMQTIEITEEQSDGHLRTLSAIRHSNTLRWKVSCKGFLEFIRLAEMRFGSSAVKPIIMLDNVEKLEALSRGLLRRVCAHDGTGFSLVLLGTSASAFQFAVSKAEADVPCIHVGCYSLEATVDYVTTELQALVEECDFTANLPADVTLNSFAFNVCQVLYPACGDDVPMLVNLSWKLLQETSDNLEPGTTKTAWLKQLHSRLIYFRNWLYQQPPSRGDRKDKEDPEEDSAKDDHTEVALPFYFKYLMVASYLASHNSPEMDVKLFTRSSSSWKRRRSSARCLSKGKGDGHLPRTFHLDRVLAILFSLLSSNEGEDLSLTVSSAEIQAQVSSMAGLGMLTKCDGPGDIDRPRYRCNIGFPVVKRISSQLNLAMEKFLA